MMNSDATGMRVRFWGVCGSVPAPLTGARVEEKILRSLLHVMREPLPNAADARESVRQWMKEQLPFHVRSTHGGNTTCAEVRCDNTLLILDMGTGLRELGIALKDEIVVAKKLRGYILQSHVHWDHIQGLPFWKPLYMPRSVFDCRFTFFGGKEWDAQLELVLQGQMNPPVFPVNLGEIRHTAMTMEFQTVWDGWTTELEGPRGPIKVRARKLNHPQETFGYRVEYAGRTLAFTTDHEPYASGIHRPLLDLVRNADLWITDCQYSHDNYVGDADGVQKLGWGHSYPEYIAKVARAAGPGRIVTTHHEPEYSDEQIISLADQVAGESSIVTQSAYEGMLLSV